MGTNDKYKEVPPKLIGLALRDVEKSYGALFDESDDVMTEQWVVKKELSAVSIVLLSKRLESATKTLRAAERMLRYENASEEERLFMEQEDKLEALNAQGRAAMDREFREKYGDSYGF